MDYTHIKISMEVIEALRNLHAAITVVEESIAKATEKISSVLFRFSHTLYHYLLHRCYSFIAKKRDNRITYRRSAVLIMAEVNAYVARLTLRYLENLKMILRSRMLRSQDRGSSEETNNDEEVTEPFLFYA